MKHAVVILVLALFLVPAILSHKQHGLHGGHKEEHEQPHTASSFNDPCKYTSTSGLHYDFGEKCSHELVYYIDSLSSTVSLRPDGRSGKNCPNNTAVCLVGSPSSLKATSFGSSKNVQWADGMDNSVEVTYGGGEICNNGIPRKTVVQYICNLEYPSGIISIINATMSDSCSLQIIVESKVVCPMEKYCGSYYTSNNCQADSVCQWNKDKQTCQLNEKNHLKFHADLLGLVLIACSAVLLVCTCGLCVCACKRRRAAKRAQIKVPARKVSRKAGKNVKKVSMEEPEYTPFQVPFQLVPGGFAPNPYSEVQGYPMTTFVTSVDHESEQHV